HHLNREVMEQVCDHFGIPRDVPWKKLPARDRKILLQGNGDTLTIQRTIEGKRLRAKLSERRKWEGVIPILERVHARLRAEATAAYMSPGPCPACGGS